MHRDERDYLRSVARGKIEVRQQRREHVTGNHFIFALIREAVVHKCVQLKRTVRQDGQGLASPSQISGLSLTGDPVYGMVQYEALCPLESQ